jgi:DNA-binding NarL/FixJ family response regulator
MAERRAVEPTQCDPSTPNIARLYDYWLGGKDNFASDRTEAGRLMAVYPHLPVLARQGRLFLARSVEWLGEQGVRQFPDLGCGLPTGENTHEIAQTVHPDCRVVYVDDDPVVMAHARALLCGPGASAIRGDMAKPDAILADVRTRRLIDLDEPTAVILAMVLHFFDAATATNIVATFARAVTPGSYVVLSVGSGDEETGGALAREYQGGTLHNHSLAQIAAFVEGLELIPPGLTDAMAWKPESPSQPPSPESGGHILAGVARKRDTGPISPAGMTVSSHPGVSTPNTSTRGCCACDSRKQ